MESYTAGNYRRRICAPRNRRLALAAVLAKDLVAFPQKSSGSQDLHDSPRVLFRRARNCIKNKFRTLWRFVGIVNSRNGFYLAALRSGIDAFGVSLLAYLDRRVDKNFYKLIASNHVADVIACSAIRTYGGTDCHTAVSPYRATRTDVRNMIVRY